MQELNGRLPQFLDSNQSKIQKAINKANESYDETIQNISKDKPFCVHPKDLDRIYKDAKERAIKTYDGARKRVTQQYDDEREKFLKVNMTFFDFL